MTTALLDNEIKCEVLDDNGVIAQITNGEKIIEVYSFRLTYLHN